MGDLFLCIILYSLYVCYVCYVCKYVSPVVLHASTDDDPQGQNVLENINNNNNNSRSAFLNAPESQKVHQTKGVSYC